MERIVRKQGILLKTTEYKENAMLVKFLTKDGIEQIIVRGAQKYTSKTRVLTNVLQLLDFNRTNYLTPNTLTEAVVLNSYYKISSDVIKYNIACCMLEKIIVLHASITNYNILFDFLVDIFNLLEDTLYPKVLLNIFELRLTYLLGIGLSFKECLVCGSKENLSFSIREGGVVCHNHKYNKIIDLDYNDTQLVKTLYLYNIDKINDEFLSSFDEKYEKIDQFINVYYSDYLDFRSRSKKILSQILNV